MPANVPGWEALGWVLAQNSRDVFEGRYDPSTNVVCWFKSLELFQELEREQMILKEPAKKDQDAHRVSLSVLIIEGERLRTRLEKAVKPVKFLGSFTREDFEAALDHLHDEQAAWYGEMSAERKAEILNAVFNRR